MIALHVFAACVCNSYSIYNGMPALYTVGIEALIGDKFYLCEEWLIINVAATL